MDIISLNPSTFHGRAGVKILQMRTPYRKAKIVADFGGDGDSITVAGVEGQQSSKWVFKTFNVKRFQFYEIEGKLFSSAAVTVAVAAVAPLLMSPLLLLIAILILSRPTEREHRPQQWRHC